MPLPNLEFIFVDLTGRRWIVYEHNLVAGKRDLHTPGGGRADYRTFVPERGGAPRQHILGDNPAGDRTLDPGVLQRQLDDGKEIGVRLLSRNR